MYTLVFVDIEVIADNLVIEWVRLNLFIALYCFRHLQWTDTRTDVG